jgi:selenocysteine lyase/cysteine desulfurase
VIGGPPSFDRVRGLREVLTATGAGIYLATHVAGPIPAESMTAVHESDEMELRVGRVGPGRADDLEQRDKEARAVAAAALRTSPERMVLLHGAADAARAITTDVLSQAHTSDARVILLGGLEPRIEAAVRSTASSVGVSVETLAAAPQILTTDVALVVMAHVDVDGARADVPAVAAVAHKAGARLLVDASLSVGALDFGVADLAADAVIADSHHWLLGPEAVAIAWLAPGLGEDLPSRLAAASAPFGRGALLALARSVGWLLMYVELPWAITRTEELAERLYTDLAAIDGIDLVADLAAHGAVAAFRITDWDAVQAVEELSRSVFAIVEADADADVVRVSVGAWNRENELDRFLERVAELGMHTPETLPRKPSLTILSGPVDPAGDE